MTDHETAFTDDVPDELPEPLHRQRVTLGLFASMLFAIGAFGAPTLLFVGGALHSVPLRCGAEGVPECDVTNIVRAIALLAAAVIAAFATRRPHRPDAIITRNLVVALAVVGVVVGLTELMDALAVRARLGDGAAYGPLQDVTAAPGPAAIAIPLAGLLCAIAGLRRGIWPKSRGAEELLAAGSRRHHSRRRR